MPTSADRTYWWRKRRGTPARPQRELQRRDHAVGSARAASRKLDCRFACPFDSAGSTPFVSVRQATARHPAARMGNNAHIQWVIIPMYKAGLGGQNSRYVNGDTSQTTSAPDGIGRVHRDGDRERKRAR